MFAENFLSISLAEVLGLLVTMVGIWLVVKQLNETRLASQMEGLMTLMGQYQDLNKERTNLVNMALERKWNKLTPEEAFSTIFNDKNLLASYIKIGNLYDMIGSLIRFKAFDKVLGMRNFGPLILREFRAYEKVIEVDRQRGPGGPMVFEDWEWLAKEVEKKDGS